MPTDKKVKRKLSAILSADVKGYSILMADDEVHTIETLKAYRQIIADLISKHSGRVVDSPGDNILAEFRSSFDAVECAVKIQKRLDQENSNYSDDKKVQFRIGVNVGDVIQDGDRIYGNGVNVAARIESLAEPGGVCISRNAYDHVSNKLNFGYEYLGEHIVKNIKKPVRVYKLLMADEDAGKLIGDVPKSVVKNWIWATIVLAAVVIAVVATLVYQKISKPEFEPASVENMAFPLPEKSSIAVLPFVNMSGDPEQEYIGDSIAENVITALSYVHEMFVISRTSTFAYKGKSVKIKQISEELGVRYVLEGSVQKSKDRIRVTAQLIDAISGHHLWADRYDRNIEDFFKVLDEIAKEVVIELQVKLTEGDISRISHKTDSFEAWLSAITAYNFVHLSTKENITKARELFEKAVRLDPEYGYAWGGLGAAHNVEGMWGWSESQEKSFNLAVEYTDKALKLDENLSCATAVKGRLYSLQGQHKQAITTGKKAIALGPSHDLSYSTLSDIMRFAGRYEESIALMEKAMRLNPYYPAWNLNTLVMNYFFLEKYEEAIEAGNRLLERAQKGEWDPLYAHLDLSVNYMHLGRDKDAKAHAERVFKEDPSFSLEFSVSNISMYKNKADYERYIESLRKVGYPDKPSTPLPHKPSIAVLPFDNLSDDPEQEYFSDGMADELLNGLAKIPGLIVKARKSSFSDKVRNQDAKTIGDMLDVTHFIEGSVRKSGDRIRVVVQLISTAEDTHIWSERYDRELTEVFAVQDEITVAILKALNVHLLGSDKSRTPTDNMEAYEAYLLGRQRLFTDSVTAYAEAVRYFQKAVDLDKDFVLAYVGLADSYVRHMWLSGLYNQMANAEAAIEHALNLDDRLGEAYSSLGFFRVFQQRSDKAEMAFKRALELNPNYIDAYYYYALMLLWTGRFEEALVQFQRGIKLDPLGMNINRWMAEALQALGRFDEAFKQYDKVIEINPLSWTAYNNKGLFYCHLGRLDDAFIMYRKAISLDPNEHILMANIGELYLTLGDIQQAKYWYQQAIWMSPNGLASEKGMFDLNVYLGKGNSAHNYGRNLMQHPKRNRYLIPILAHFQELDLQAGRNDEARAWFGQAYPELLFDTAPTIDFNNYEAAIAFAPALIKTGEQERANLLLDLSLNYIRTLPRLGGYGFGIADVHIYTLQGKIQQALESLREAVDSGWRMGWWSLQLDPILKPVHNEPEFKAIVQEIEVDMAAQLARIRSRDTLSPIVDLYEQAKPEAPEVLTPKGVTVADGVLTHSNAPAFTLEIPLACKPKRPNLDSGQIHYCSQGVEPWNLIVSVYYLEGELETAAKDRANDWMAWIESIKSNGKVLNIGPIDTYDEFKAMQVEIEHESPRSSNMLTLINHLIEKEGKVIQMTAWVRSDPSLATDIFESIDLDP